MAALLEAEHLAAGYGPAEVLFDINLAIGEGEVVTLLGRNGMGKTTTIRVLMGLLHAERRRPRGSPACRSPGCRPIASPSSASASSPKDARYFRRSPSRKT